MSIGTNLKRLREERNLKTEDVAKFLGITLSAYNYFEADKRNPKTENVIKLAKFYNVSADYILGIIDIPRELEQSDNIKFLDLFEKISNFDVETKKILAQSLDAIGKIMNT